MYRIVLVILLALALGSVAQADSVYKWVDAQGNVHYSDHPHPGSERLKLPKAQTYASPVSATIPMQTSLADTGPAPARTQISISSPADQANLWNVDSVTVSASVSPALQEGDTITYTLDGQTEGPITSLSATFKNVPRGQHSASAVLHTSAGDIPAKPVTFYLHKHSILGKKPPL